MIVCDKGGYFESMIFPAAVLRYGGVYYIGGIIGNYGALFAVNTSRGTSQTNFQIYYAFVMSQNSNVSGATLQIYGIKTN